MPAVSKPIFQAGYFRAAFIFISKYWEHDNSHQASKLPAYVHKPDMGITEKLDSSASQTRDA